MISLFDLPPFTGAWGFVINNVGIYDFVLGWLALQSISEDHKRAVARRLTGSQGTAKVSLCSRGCCSSKDWRLLLSDLSVFAGDNAAQSFSCLVLTFEGHPAARPTNPHF